MAAQGHTPGPWFAIWNGHFWDINVGNYLHAQSVASNHANAVLKMSAEEAEANACLIAAAPDLLAFAQALDASWTESFPDGPDGPCEILGGIGRLADEHRALWKQCRAAISRASGESQ